MNPINRYSNRIAEAQAVTGTIGIPYRVLLAAAATAALVFGAGCAKRPVVVASAPPRAAAPQPRVELERKVQGLSEDFKRYQAEAERKYTELEAIFKEYKTQAGEQLRKLSTDYDALNKRHDNLQQRVGVVETKQGEMLQTQASILQRPLNEVSILISKRTHTALYRDFFGLISGVFAPELKSSATLNGTHIYLVPTISGDYNAYVASDVKQAGNLLFIGRYHPPAPGSAAVVVPAARIREKVPEGILQQSLNIREIKPVDIPGRADFKAPAQRRTPTKKPFSRTHIEKWTRPNGHSSTRRYYYARR